MDSIKEAKMLKIVKQTVEITLLLQKIFEGENDKVHFWLTTMNLNFGGSTPLKLIQMGKGHKDLEFIKNAQRAD